MWVKNLKISSFYLMKWILYMIKLLLINPLYYSIKSNLFCLLTIIISPIRVKMSWNIGDNRNLFLKLKLKLGLYHVVLTTPKTSPQKLTLSVVEMQQLPDIDKIDFKEEICCLTWTKYSGRRKLCMNFWTDTDKLNIVVDTYRKNLYLKDIKVHLKLTEYQSLLSKRVYLLSYLDIFYKQCIVLDETTRHN